MFGVAQVRAEDGDRLVCDGPGGVEREPQRGRKVGRRDAADDDGNHRPIGVAVAEQADFLVHCGPRGSNGRAQHDERRRPIERGDGGVVQRVPADELVAVAENRTECGRYWPARGGAPGQVFVDCKAFKGRMEPSRPSAVGVGIGEEGFVRELTTRH